MKSEEMLACAENITNEGYGDWDEFRANMEGAKVNIQLKREGEEIYMTAIATTIWSLKV